LLLFPNLVENIEDGIETGYSKPILVFTASLLDVQHKKGIL